MREVLRTGVRSGFVLLRRARAAPDVPTGLLCAAGEHAVDVITGSSFPDDGQYQ